MRKDDKQAEGGEALLQRLLETRTVIISQEINDELTRKVITELMLLEASDDHKPIHVLINSPGGSADSGFAIFDLLRFIKPPVVTLAVGLVASAASIILLGTEKAKRLSLPHARYLLHQPSTQLQGVAADIEITATEILKLREKANRIISDETGQPIDKVATDMDRDFWMSAEQAVKYGLVSRIISKRSEL